MAKNKQQLNVNDLRNILAEEISKLRDGQTTAANVNAINNATGKIIATVKIEMEYCKLVGKTPRIEFISLEKTGPDKKALK